MFRPREAAITLIAFVRLATVMLMLIAAVALHLFKGQISIVVVVVMSVFARTILCGLLNRTFQPVRFAA